MAQKTYIQHTDDFDGTEATHTIRFGYDGRSYIIDLNDANAAVFTELIGRYVDVARVDVGLPEQQSRRAAAGGAKSVKGYEPKAVRAWAKAQGLEIGDRGRIQEDVVAAYLAATKS